MIICESERLILRQVTKNDYDLMRHLDVDPVVKEYLGPALKEDEIKARFEKCFELYENGKGLGKWMATVKETKEDIGWFVLNKIPDTDHIEIGYRLKAEAWGKGYATELSRELLEYGFSKLKLDKIIGITHLENIPSQKVLLKIGLEYVREDFLYNTQVKFFELYRKAYVEQYKI